jgi:hypothetical protein
MRYLRFVITFALFGLLAAGVSARLRAQAAPDSQITAPGANRITAENASYRIEWNGTSGTFVQKAIGKTPEVRQPLAYLHTDAGPAGFAKHLAWFLARESGGFSVLWCYLNDSGTEFDCWLYRFPSNLLTAIHFKGAYQYAPPSEAAPAVPMPDFNLSTFPPYTGPAFTFRGWTKAIGGLAQLDLKATRLTNAPPATPDTGTVVKTLTQIIVRPLHQVEVGAANGWREGGWHELHALAFDSAKDPYYFILYSNTTTGYVVDLKRAQIYTADFGGRVAFEDTGLFGPQDNPLNIEPDIKVHRYERHEIVLTTKAKPANPYLDIQAGIEFTGPNAKPVLVPGFWDGGGTFRVRFTPTIRGVWKWRSLSETSDLNGQTGDFECIGEDRSVKGFVNVQPEHKNPRHFSYSNGDPFLPVLVREPQPSFVTPSGTERTGAIKRAGVQLAAQETAAEDDTSSFLAYQRFINAAAQKGFNRLVGGNLLGPAATKLIRSDEGGAAFASGDLDTINPAFFQWMDRRIAYCNARGIVPDIGIGTLEDRLFTTYKPASLYRFWGYIVARYSAYDVQWTLFEPGAGTPSEATRKGAEQFADLTRLYDPCHHPLTLVVLGTSAAPISAPPKRATAPTTDTAGASALGQAKAPVAVIPYNVAWEDVITALGGDVNALPWYAQVTKPVVLMERPTVGKDTALTPDVARHRMWEARMRGAYWAPGVVPAVDPAALNAPEIQWAAYCANLFSKTRFYRLNPRPDMLGGPAESAADRRRRKKAEAAAPKVAPPPDVGDLGDDFDPFDPDPFAALPPLPVPKPTPMFVLADPAREYVVYFEEGGSLLLDLLEATGKVQVTWFNPRTGEFSPTKQIVGGAYTQFTAPDTKDWVLYVARL